MNIYLVQHGDALPKGMNPQRPLSDNGRRRVRSVASFMNDANVVVSRVLHSGKLRARETAEIIAEVLPIGTMPETLDGINPLDPPETTAAEIQTWDRDVILVGHLPHLGRLVGRLVTGDENVAVAAFTPGTIIRLERGEDGGFAIAWMLRPELFERRRNPYVG